MFCNHPYLVTGERFIFPAKIGILGSSIKECWIDEVRGNPTRGRMNLGKKKGIAREEGSKRQPSRRSMDKGVIVLVRA